MVTLTSYGTSSRGANSASMSVMLGRLDASDDQIDDAFMLHADTRSWTGVRLLRHLTGRLDPESRHLPLNLHTLHALVASRPSLLRGRPSVQQTLGVVLDRLGSVDDLPRAVRDQVAGLHYALRLADR